MKVIIPAISRRSERPSICRISPGISTAMSLSKCGIELCLSPVFYRMMLVLLAGWHTQVTARDYFDPSLLEFGQSSGQTVDLSQFETAGGQAPGTYRVDIYINSTFFDSRDVTFQHNGADSNALVPVLTPNLLEAAGVNVGSIPALKALPPDKPMGSPLSKFIPQATAHLNFSQMKLSLSVPQIAMKPLENGLVDPKLWQEGIPAFLLNYNINGNQNRRSQFGNKQTSQSLFGSFNSGLNLGAWRLRNTATYSYSTQTYNWYDSFNGPVKKTTQSQQSWNFLQTYLQRDVVMLRSDLTIGDTSTGNVAGQVFDGFPYRGIGLASSDAMMPGRQSGFAPIISGIAKSNAQITVTQNGSVIYQTNVAPGPFRITDLVGSSTAGDLQVTITEADGTHHGFSQAYSSLPMMLRQGQFKYEVAAGRYRAGGYNNRKPVFGMASMIYGLPGNVTLYGGGLVAQSYQSAALGAGFSLGMMGALSADVTTARTRLQNATNFLRGESYRAKYSKSMLTTGTTVDLTAYRYSTRNYLSFSDANIQGYSVWGELPYWMSERRRSSWQTRLSQSLPGNYSLWLSGRRDNYWGSSKTNTTLSMGLNGSFYRVGWGLNYSIDRMRGNGDWPENRQISLNVNVPLSLFGSYAALNNAYANYNFFRDSSGRSNSQLGLGGSVLDDNSLSWSVSQSQANQGQGNSGSVSMGYNGAFGQANLGYNYDSQGGRSVNYGVNGGLIAHQHGVTLTSRIGDAAVLVRTAGVEGVRVMNSSSVTTDRWGYAVMPYARTYSRNSISLDPSSLPEGANMEQGSKNVFPTKGAVVIVDYPVRIGQQLLMNLTYRGKPVPFGAMAGLKGEADTNLAAIVGDGGQVYLSGMPSKGVLKVKWSNTPDSQCEVAFDLGAPPIKKKGDKSWSPMRQLNETCR
ncbi:fimbria/pilus outer membrane usher protein [Photorhabdus heterorhabditis]|uniref:fimbria/pilus outer membrane usher protein n=1 Tax=Photorhabdus heterorhabditis TaxID=880156 RepID=UPI0021D20CEB|nr:fimbria/pilus outer membrane usher protein [Photorhabdus heterorhabditis]